MKQDDYWERFLESGSVMDYLEFRAECAQRDAQGHNLRTDEGNRLPNETVREHAGFCSLWRKSPGGDLGFYDRITVDNSGIREYNCQQLRRWNPSFPDPVSDEEGTAASTNGGK